MRLIDADAIDYRNDRLHDQSADFIGGVIYANACVNEAPTIEIVRCKECKYAHLTYDGDCKYCDIWFPDEARYLKGNNFCSYGERREP